MEMEEVDIVTCDDKLLKKVAEGLELLTRSLHASYPLLPPDCLPLVHRLLVIHARSKSVLDEFGEFYCLRLLLDRDSALATYFIDFFCQLNWLLQGICTPRTTASSTTASSCFDLWSLLAPALRTCRNLYSLCKTSPTACTKWLSRTEFKRDAKRDRSFSNNMYHSRLRKLGFVKLDQPGQIMIKLCKELGSGSFAKVYRGCFEVIQESGDSPKQVGEPVAVKAFQDNNHQGASSGFGTQWFECIDRMMSLRGIASPLDKVSEELERLVQVKHPNIVEAKGYIGRRLDICESGLVMELMDESLQQHLERISYGAKRPLEEGEVVDLMLEIATGMRHLHECGLMHRDLKPGNVLLRFSNMEQVGCTLMEVKLADFGLTKPFLSHEQNECVDGHLKLLHTAPVGTTCYMPPELLEIAGDEAYYDDKADVFSFGTTCFNILTCDVPGALGFTSPCNRHEFYKDVKTGRWKRWVKGKAEYLVDLVAQCWETNPGLRPTFATICSFLQQVLRCMLLPPVLHVSNLPDVQPKEYKLLMILESPGWVMWTRNLPRSVIGTKVLHSCLHDFATDINKDHMIPSDQDKGIVQPYTAMKGIKKSLLKSSVVAAAKLVTAIAENYKGIATTKATVEVQRYECSEETEYAIVLALSQLSMKVLLQLLRRRQTWQAMRGAVNVVLKPLVGKSRRRQTSRDSMGLLTRRQTRRDSMGLLTRRQTSRVVIVKAGTQCQIPMRTMALHALLYDTLVSSRMVATIDALMRAKKRRDILNFSRRSEQLFDFRRDAASSELQVDASIMPMLKCFLWNSLGSFNLE